MAHPESRLGVCIMSEVFSGKVLAAVCYWGNDEIRIKVDSEVIVLTAAEARAFRRGLTSAIRKAEQQEPTQCPPAEKMREAAAELSPSDIERIADLERRMVEMARPRAMKQCVRIAETCPLPDGNGIAKAIAEAIRREMNSSQETYYDDC